MEITGFHGTHSGHINSIDKNGLDPSKTRYREDHWLGNGLYFFSSGEQAIWWAKSLSDKKLNSGLSPVVYEAIIEADEKEILDLRDNYQLAIFYDRLINNIIGNNNPNDNIDIILSEDVGKAILFDYYKKKYNISVIIAVFSKNCVKYANIQQQQERLKLQKQLVKNLRIYFNELQICVSKKSCIKEYSIWYNSDYEVI